MHAQKLGGNHTIVVLEKTEDEAVAFIVLFTVLYEICK